MSAMLTLGYPRGQWGVAANRHPVHEVSSRNRWGAPFGIEVPQPLWPHQDDDGDRPGRGGMNRRLSYPPRFAPKTSRIAVQCRSAASAS